MNAIINNCITALNNIGRAFCDYSADVFIQSALLIILLLLIDFMLRKRVRATFRYWMWILVFIKLILPPTLSLPTGIGYWCGDFLSSDSSIFRQASITAQQESFEIPVIQDFPESSEVPAINESMDSGGIATSQNSTESARVLQISRSQTSVETTVPAVPKNPILNTITWQAIVFLIWLVGVLVISVLLIQRMLFVKGLIAQSKPSDKKLAGVLNQCRRQLGIGRHIELRLSNNISSPAVCGLFKAILLIPTALDGKLSPEKLRAIFIHELVHIQRGDLWINLVQTVLQIIYFYNPLVWLVNAVVRSTREQAVDEKVLVVLGTEVKNYSNTLIDIAEMAFLRTSLSLRLIGVVESKRALNRRINLMLNRPVPKSAKLGVLGLVVIIIIGAILLPMAKGNKADKDTSTLPSITFDPPEMSLKAKPAYATDEPIELYLSWADNGWVQTIDNRVPENRGKWILFLRVNGVDYLQGELPILVPEYITAGVVRQGRNFDAREVRSHDAKPIEFPPGRYEASYIYKDVSAARPDEPQKIVHFGDISTNEVEFDIVESDSVSSLEFKKTLPNGITVELIGICEHPGEGKQWWRPDGEILSSDQAPSEYSRMTVKPDENEQARELALRFSGSDVDSMSFRWNIDKSTRSSSHPFYVSGKREKFKPFRNIVFKLPGNIKTFDLNVGIAVGEWKKVAYGGDGRTVSGTNDSLTDSSVIFHEAVEQDDMIELSATHLLGDDYDCRIVVVDKNNEIHEPVKSSNSGSDMRLCKGFFDLPKAQIKHIVLHARPYEWCEFENISLKPNFKTDMLGEFVSVLSEATGRVVDVNGQGVGGATLKFYKFGTDKKSPKIVTTTRSDKTGRFHFPVIKTGEHLSVSISAPGFAKRRAGDVYSAADGPYSDGTNSTDNLIFKLKRLGIIEGRVIGPNGNSLVWAPLSLSTTVRHPGCSESTRNHFRAITDEQGHFRMENVPPGTHLLYYPWSGPSSREVSSGMWRAFHGPDERLPSVPVKGVCAAKVIKLGDGQELSGIVIDLSKSTCAVEGQVHDMLGRAVPNAMVSLYWVYSNGYNSINGKGYPPVATDAEGHYRLQNLPPGDWHIRTWHDKVKQQSKPVLIELKPGRTIRQDLTLSGQVELDNTRTDMRGEVLVVEDVNPANNNRKYFSRTNVRQTRDKEIIKTLNKDTEPFEERVSFYIRDYGDGVLHCIDFDNNKIVRVPDELDIDDKSKIMKWVKENGIDAMIRNACQLVSLDMTSVMTENSKNDRLTTNTLENLSKKTARSTDILYSNEDGYLYYAFKTSQDSIGVVGLSSIENEGLDYRSLLIKYKLLKTDVQDENILTEPIESKKVLETLDGTNNQASSKLIPTGQQYKSESTKVDIAIEDKDLRVIKLSDRIYQATIILRNKGSVPIPQFRVNFYAGDPDKGGRLLSLQQAGPIMPGDSWGEYNPGLNLKPDETVISVVVDPDSKVEELDETNNKASQVISMLASESEEVNKVGTIQQVDLAGDDILLIEAQEAKGFNLPYYLFVPRGLDKDRQVYMLVETNNSGTVSDDLEFHRAKALMLVKRSHANQMATQLDVPLLVPTFPRPKTNWWAYTHALDIDTLEIEEGMLKRVDLQLTAMIKHAQELLRVNGFKINEKVFMHGFSASAKFCNRYSYLHPEMVKAVAAGGVNGLPTLPVREWNDCELPFPIGIAGIERFIDGAFNEKAFRQVAHYIYMGSLDRNDTLPSRDAWREEEADIIKKALAEKMMPDRWELSRKIYNQQNLPAQLVTYNGVTHAIKSQMLDDVIDFFKANSGEKFVRIEPYEYPFVESEEIRPKQKSESTKIDIAIDDKNLTVTKQPDGLFKALVRIYNKSSMPLPQFGVYFYAGDPDKGGRLLATHAAGPIRPGDNWGEYNPHLKLKPDENTITVVVDPDNKVEELDETNNKVSAVIPGREPKESVETIYKQTAQPEAEMTAKETEKPAEKVTGIDITPADFYIRLDERQGTCVLVVSIQNKSNLTIPKFRLNFYRGDPSDNLSETGNLQTGSHGAGPIEPGKTWNEGTRAFHLPDGQYDFNVFLDFDNRISEIDENNNQALLQVRIENGRIADKLVTCPGGPEGVPAESKVPAKMVGTWFFDNPGGDNEQMAVFPDGRVVVLYSNGHKDQTNIVNGFIALAEYNNAKCRMAVQKDGTLVQYFDLGGGKSVGKQWMRISPAPHTNLLRPLTGAPEGIGKFSVTLSNDLTVELIGVCEHPSKGKQWWRPDGGSLPKAPYEFRGGQPIENMDEQKNRLVEFAISFAGRKLPYTDVCYTIPGATRTSGGGDVQPTPEGTIKSIACEISKSRDTAEVHLGVAAGQWKTITEYDGGRGFVGPNDIVFSDPIETKRGTTIAVMGEWGSEGARRITAVDKNGKTHTGGWNGRSTGLKTLATTSFYNVKPEQIQKYQLQFRPYEWIEFKNVSLRPGLKTDVEF